MRRTDQEFKNEIFRRERAYRTRQKKIRNCVVTGALCLVLACAGVWGVMPRSTMEKDVGWDNMMEAQEPMYSLQDSVTGMESAVEVPEAIPAEGEMNGSTNGGIRTVILTEEDAGNLSEYLEGEWVSDLTNCACDYMIILHGRELRYHTECGSFQDYTSGSSLTVTEEARQQINKMLQGY